MSSTATRTRVVLRLFNHHAPDSYSTEPAKREIPRSVGSKQIVQPLDRPKVSAWSAVTSYR
jgi:hypothetical protein